jgi:hypothetical protein
VETLGEIETTIATFIAQDGVLDLGALTDQGRHKVLVTGYDFLDDSSRQVRGTWKRVYTCRGLTGGALETCLRDDGSTSPVDGVLVPGAGGVGDWGLGSVGERVVALGEHLGGSGGERYGVMNLNGHATHYQEGVPGTNPQDIQGLEASEILGLNLAGGVIYAVGCHGGLSVPGSEAGDADHSLDLAQTFLSRGVVTYVSNTGYGWGLKQGVGYGERLVQLLTEELTRGGTIVIGDAVRTAKRKYVLEGRLVEPYGVKTLMQWTVFGLPMYGVKTGLAVLGSSSGEAGVTSEETVPAGSSTSTSATQVSSSSSEPPPAPYFEEQMPASRSAIESYGGVRVERGVSTSTSGSTSTGSSASASSSTGVVASAAPLPSYLTQLNLRFDFSAAGVYRKWTGSGEEIADLGTACTSVSASGCYYTLNGVVERASGDTDLPVQPYFVYDSRLSGTSQHGVLWKGGEYVEEGSWRPVFGELASNLDSGAGDADPSDHGGTPQHVLIEPTANVVVPGKDPQTCRTSDVELNSLVVNAGEALQGPDLEYSLQRRYRSVDLEVLYFNDPTPESVSNCDRLGPVFGSGPYHTVVGPQVSWRVEATDAGTGVWRVLVVYTDNHVDGSGRGRWVPLELEGQGDGTWTGRVTLPGVSRVTYVVQAVDERGNVSWVRYQSALPGLGAEPGGVPASGVPLDVPLATAVELVSRKRGLDFDGDGRTDILWRHQTVGDAYLWLEEGPASKSQHFLGLVDPTWEVQGTGDHDGDGMADILWRHRDGYIYIWLMNGAVTVGEGLVDVVSDPDWEIVGTADLTGEGKADILWRHRVSGVMYLWVMNGLSVQSQEYVGTLDPGWGLAGVSDGDGDGRADLLWRHTLSGVVYVWRMNGAVTTAVEYVDTVADLGWQVAGYADFDGDLRSDVLWRHGLTGDVWLWGMNGSVVTSRSYVGTGAATEWGIVGVGDQGGDGRADVLWRHVARGDLYLWEMDGAAIASHGFAGSVGTDWDIVGMR